MVASLAAYVSKVLSIVRLGLFGVSDVCKDVSCVTSLLRPTAAVLEVLISWLWTSVS